MKTNRFEAFNDGVIAIPLPLWFWNWRRGWKQGSLL